MGLPVADGGHVEIGMLSRGGVPWASQSHGQSDGISREGFDNGSGARTSNVGANDTPNTIGAVETPESDHGINVAEPLEQTGGCGQVIVQSHNGGGGSEDVESLEDLIKGMAKRTGGLDAEEDKGACGNKAGKDKVARRRGEDPTVLAIVGKGMSESLKNDNTAKPTVDQVVGVKGDVQEGDERVVSSSQKEERDHVDS